MNRFIIVVAMLAALVQTSAPVRAESIVHDGIARTYRVHQPQAVSGRPVPLVLVLHGGYGTARQAEDTYHWDAQADRNGFVVAYPDGIGRAWNAGSCCGFPSKRNLDDVGYLTDLIATLEKQIPIDPRRIYVTGISNGAMMTYRMACESPVAIAAIAPVAGTFSKSCDRPKATSVIAVHGTADRNVPMAGGIGIGVDKSPRPAVRSVIDAWRTTDACAPSKAHTVGNVTFDSAACANGRGVELITIAGAGHQWPGSEPIPAAVRDAAHAVGLADPSPDLDATATIWQFFAAHPAP